MVATIRCAECEKVMAQSPDAGADAVMVSCHATAPHHAHPLDVAYSQVDWEGAPCLPCVITCIEEKCYSKRPREAVFSIPWWAVGAAAIAFHSAHEGHRLHFTFAGVEIESP